MPSFTNMKDLEKFLLGKINEAMKPVGELGETTVKDHVESDVYKEYQPNYYHRTGELKESIQYDKKVDGCYVNVSIFSNPDVMIPRDKHSVTGGELTQHYSMFPYAPMEYNQYVAQTVEEGSSGTQLGFGVWTEPRPFMHNAYLEMVETNSPVEMLKFKLHEKGIKTT